MIDFSEILAHPIAQHKWYIMGATVTSTVAAWRWYLDYKAKSEMTAVEKLRVEGDLEDKEEVESELATCGKKLDKCKKDKHKLYNRSRKAIHSLMQRLPSKSDQCPAICPAREQLPSVLEELVEELDE